MTEELTTEPNAPSTLVVGSMDMNAANALLDMDRRATTAEQKAERVERGYILLKKALEAIVKGVVNDGDHPGHNASKSELQKAARKALNKAEEAVSGI